MDRRSSLRLAAAFVCVLGMAGTASAAPSPDDNGAGTDRIAAPALPTSLFDLGITDLLTLGVSDEELATAGTTAASDSDTVEASSTSSSGMLMVDDDGADCKDATFTTIQSAVTAAPAGATVVVCPGTYVEQVTVPAGKDDLKLVSKKHLRAVIEAPPLMLDPKAIVRVNGAQDVDILHFTITGPGGSGCDSLRYGVRVDGGGSAKIEHNHITLIQDTPFSGCQNGNAIQVGRMFEATTGRAEIKRNLLDRYQKTGVVVDNAGSYAEIEHNKIIGPGPQPTIAPNGVQVSRGAGADVDHNVVTGNAYTGLFFGGTGVLLFQAGAGLVEVDHNRVYENDDGISLYDTDNALIEHNRSKDQLRFDGLYADSDSAGNRFEHNKADDNFEHDCHDDSAGAGTAGTANFWIKNHGHTENRPGLCKH